MSKFNMDEVSYARIYETFEWACKIRRKIGNPSAAGPAEENIMETYCGDGNISNGLGRNAVRNRLCVLLIGRGGGSRREQRPPPDYPHRL